jgi:hypothetical protein
MKFILAMCVLTMIGSLASLAFTAINYLKKDNEFEKIMSITILVTGVLATILMLILMIKDFSVFYIIVIVRSSVNSSKRSDSA